MEIFVKEILIKAIRQILEEFLEENPVDAVDVCILDNYNDYLCDRLTAFIGGMKKWV